MWAMSEGVCHSCGGQQAGRACKCGEAPGTGQQQLCGLAWLLQRTGTPRAAAAAAAAAAALRSLPGSRVPLCRARLPWTTTGCLLRGCLRLGIGLLRRCLRLGIGGVGLHDPNVAGAVAACWVCGNEAGRMVTWPHEMQVARMAPMVAVFSRGNAAGRCCNSCDTGTGQTVLTGVAHFMGQHRTIGLVAKVDQEVL